MHFPNAWTCAKPFASRPDIDSKTCFYLRVIKRHFDLWMSYESEDDQFLRVIDAAFQSNGSGPLPFGPIFGTAKSFERAYEASGYKEPVKKGRRASAYFFPHPYGDDRLVNKYSNLILHIPHSGTEFYDNQKPYRETFLEKARDLVDWYTDELFSPDEEDKRIIPVVFPLCRTACDVERMIDDPLEKKNLGINYDGNIFSEWNGVMTIGHSNYAQLCRYDEYIEHHHKMEDLINKHYGCLVIDCHSFSSRPTLLLPDSESAAKYDICIGYNEDRTRPDEMIIGTICNHFEALGYKVGVNKPFSNSKTFNTPESYKSIMIEVNKRIYMDEATLQKTEGFQILHQQILDLYEKILDSK